MIMILLNQYFFTFLLLNACWFTSCSSDFVLKTLSRASKWFKNVNFFSFFCLSFFDERNVKYYAKNIFLILFMYFQKRDHILILNILLLRQIIPEARSKMRDLHLFIFILKTTGTFTPVHSAEYLILRNEFRST